MERGLARRFDQVFVHNRFQVRKLQSAEIDHQLTDPLDGTPERGRNSPRN
jgi:hypothetical protein